MVVSGLLEVGMLQVRKGLLLLGVWLLLTGVPVFSDSLSYDMATGTLSGFDVNTSDTIPGL